MLSSKSSVSLCLDASSFANLHVRAPADILFRVTAPFGSKLTGPRPLLAGLLLDSSASQNAGEEVSRSQGSEVEVLATA